MHRIFLEIGSLSIAWFGVMMATAFLVGLFQLVLIGRKEGRDSNFCSDLLLWIMVSSILCARLAYVISDLPYYIRHPGRILLVNQGGIIYYGGFVGAVIGVTLFALRRHERVLAMLDFVVTAVPLGHMFGRIGCFLNGCCFGSRWDGPLAVTYPPNSFAWQAHLEAGLIGRYSRSLPVHPVQLYEAAANFLLFLLLLWAFKRRRRDGQVLALYFTTYPLVRFLAEFLRGDERMRWQGLNVAQEISIALFVVGIGLWLWTLRGKAAAPAQTTSART
jgi:phosphatidylglycerol:prolipoprotein diacylglycerol transferase